MDKLQSYLKQKASKIVSAFVLVGCILITAVLVYSAIKAQALGERFTPNTASYDIEGL